MYSFCREGYRHLGPVKVGIMHIGEEFKTIIEGGGYNNRKTIMILEVY
jgi:hypothetical protein